MIQPLKAAFCSSVMPASLGRLAALDALGALDILETLEALDALEPSEAPLAWAAEKPVRAGAMYVAVARPPRRIRAARHVMGVVDFLVISCSIHLGEWT